MSDRNGACPDPGGVGGREPSTAELAAIEAEWPLIEVELAELDAQIVEILHGAAAAEWVWRRARRLRRQVLGAAVRVVDGGWGVAA